MKLIFFMMMCVISVSACAGDDPVDRIKKFNESIFTGEYLNPEEWMTQEALSSEIFGTFGGFDALVQQSTSQANNAGGFDKTVVKVIEKNNSRLVVETTTFFIDGTSSMSKEVWVKSANGDWLLGR
jgi:hypothetical protein